ncbi:hypothetical protein [Pseudotamlana carrageenivorans]|uniref:Uncharacterized protein n=1 Tax=Pseudotamlana carrageenivorans TaxID=2069432 RepID=A0A2I7SE44_9FLAO|nr:hypothetical protein [Tamlana carrageenivorans]AUS04158.1 hypothetical protein C1A40_01090 [Tamlana carrageenivorans]
MKYFKQICLFLLAITFFSCSSDDESRPSEYEFVKEYSTTVTVGGFVGIAQRNFQIGEVYKGTKQGNGTISIRIAEHSELNDDCPNSWCYQELLDVPQEFLKSVE